ncbi:MAG: hypothetical protein IJ260_05785 [Butyrivibrio sp.]|nr:hypothetical protein [Butyrivibrio sp.]MBQ8031024.1 hypothetical protein [Butyrivibrio sp.]MBR1642607.1 hypothetical protein [Butyrivibrio sp.]
MTLNKAIVIGQKESFFIKVLIKKMQDGMIQTKYVQNSVDDINNNINDADIAVYYMDSGEMIEAGILRFISDTLHDKEKKAYPDRRPC